MPIVVADTGPLNYLIQIGHVNILAELFGRVLLPPIVQAELAHPDAPVSVQAWIGDPPDWLEVREAPLAEILPGALDAGEKAAISLALAVHADLVLIDDREGAAVARTLGLQVTGTLGTLDAAADQGLLDLNVALELLRRTNFRWPERIIAQLLEKNQRRRAT